MSDLNRTLVNLFFFIWIILSLAAGFCVPMDRYILSIPYLLIIEVINIGIAYDITLLLCATFAGDGEPPKLDQLDQFPSVALLYLSYNDAMPEALSRLNNQTYRNHKVFVLDDSTCKKYKDLVDTFGFETIRRGYRKGGKAGNLNHWLAVYGEQFEYFVILDNDGILESNFIEEMLKYAEHPDNENVAVFQSVRKAWNTNRIFPRLLDVMYPLRARVDLRVFNRSNSLLSAGCNILCRVKPYYEIGGFDENYVTEDFATNLRLVECGYQIKAVNILSYIAVPETAQFYAAQMARWASGTLETAISRSWNLPFASQLRMFMGVHNYARWLFYALGMLLVVWGYRVTWQQLYITAFIAFRWRYPGIILYPLVAFFFLIVYKTLIKPLWINRLTGISLLKYWGCSILGAAVGFYSLFYLISSQISSLLGKRAVFVVQEKRWYKSRFWDILKGMKWTILFALVIAAGLVNNPVARVVHFIWFIPLFFSPLIIYWLQNAPVNEDICLIHEEL